MITSTILDGLFGMIEDKVKIEDCAFYKDFCEVKETLLAKFDDEMKEKLNFLLNAHNNLQEDITYQKNILALNYGIKIGMELQEFFESLIG